MALVAVLLPLTLASTVAASNGHHHHHGGKHDRGRHRGHDEGNTSPSVVITDDGLRPATLTINAGQTVTWFNDDFDRATIVSDTGAWPPATLGEDQTFTHTFSTPGRYPYHVTGFDDDETATFSGTIVVNGSPGTTATPTNTPAPTATSTPVPTATNTPVPAATNTPVPTATNTPVPTATNTPVPTATNTPLPTNTPAPLPTDTPTPLPTDTPTPLPTNTPTPLPTATNTPVPPPTNTPVPPPTNTPVPPPTSFNVVMIDGAQCAGCAGQFQPPTLTIPVGATVTWTNTGTNFHTTTCSGSCAPAGASGWDSGILPPGAPPFSHTFTTEGTYSYVCVLHAGSGMTGTIVVTASGGGATATSTPTPVPTNTPTPVPPTSTPTPMPTATNTPLPTSTPTPVPVNGNVSMVDTSGCTTACPWGGMFIPQDLTVPAGTTITWKNVSGFHTTTSKNIPAGATNWDSGLVMQGSTYQVTLTVPGTYTYVCSFHSSSPSPGVYSGMVGTITVN